MTSKKNLFVILFCLFKGFFLFALRKERNATTYLLQSKEKEMSETQGAVEKAKRLMVEKQRFEEIFRRPDAGGK